MNNIFSMLEEVKNESLFVKRILQCVIPMRQVF